MRQGLLRLVEGDQGVSQHELGFGEGGPHSYGFLQVTAGLLVPHHMPVDHPKEIRLFRGFGPLLPSFFQVPQSLLVIFTRYILDNLLH